MPTRETMLPTTPRVTDDAMIKTWRWTTPAATTLNLLVVLAKPDRSVDIERTIRENVDRFERSLRALIGPVDLGDKMPVPSEARLNGERQQ